MTEEILVTARANAKVDPVLDIWHWEVPAYLFVGGLTAGIMVFAAVMILLRRERQAPFTVRQLPLFAPIVLSVGMLTLFLDLEHKLMVWRFYTTFQPTSPMSWGSWVLLLVYPASVALILAYLRSGYPRLAGYAERYPLGRLALDLCERRRRPLAWVNLLLGVFLGIYTGILLSAFSARPFWNTGVLGPLFLVSGLSTAAALAILGAREAGEKHLFTRIDVGLIVLELVLLALLLVNLATGNRVQLQALGHLLGGDFTAVFWLWLVTVGLLLPLLLEVLDLNKVRVWVFLSPLLVIAGGYLLRHVTVELGQVTTWVHYTDQFNTDLLERLKGH
jgi:protein NrfD